MSNDNAIPSNEFELIQKLQGILSGVSTKSYEILIGDDAAVRRCNQEERLVFTTDVSVENVHFKTEYMSFKEIGFRTMVSNLSDCAAMGATPDSALIQLTFPSKCAHVKAYIQELYTGFADACRRWNFPVVGGDLSGGQIWTIGITMIGKIPKNGKTLKRTGIRAGDSLWVTGMPGCSAAGLAALKSWDRDVIPEQFKSLLIKHIQPIPRIEYGLSLAVNRHVHAAMDLSDGLSKDCSTLAYENDLGLLLFSDTSQIPAEMVKLSSELGIPWELWYLHGGEEYELLFAASREFIIDSVSGAESFIRIGTFTDEHKDILVRKDGVCNKLEAGSFDHLR